MINAIHFLNSLIVAAVGVIFLNLVNETPKYKKIPNMLFILAGVILISFCFIGIIGILI